MGFKDQLKKDIATFLNTDEFADVHTIDGVKMTVIIDQFELIERSARVGASTDGVYQNSILIFVPVAEYGARPKVGKMLNLDGTKLYRIAEVIEENGLYSFTLEANRA